MGYMNSILIKQIFVIGGMMQFQFCFLFLQSSSQVLLIKKRYPVHKARFMFCYLDMCKRITYHVSKN